MKYITDKRFFKFFIPSLIGAILFIVPINQDGNLSIPIAVVANLLLELMGNNSLTIIWLLISISSVVTLVHKFIGIELLKRNKKLNDLFSIKGFWFIIRMIGFLFVNMIYFNVGPDFIIGDLTGGLVVNDLIPILVCVFLLAGILLALLLNYGL